MEIERKKKIIAAAVVLILVVLLSVFFWMSDSPEKPPESSDTVSETELNQEEEPEDEPVKDTENGDLSDVKSEEPAEDSEKSEEVVEEPEKTEDKTETDKPEEEKKDEVIETENDLDVEIDEQTQSETSDSSGAEEQSESKNQSSGDATDHEKDDSSSSKTPDIPVRKPEKQYAQIENGKISCDAFGRYSGQYVENGRDEPVESVAAILITNQSDEYLEYATLTFDIDGNAGNFIVTGLPSGASAWVMDANRLVIESGAAFTYLECVSSFRDDVHVSSDKINLTADGNMMTATNVSEETLKEVVVYYRGKHSDGNYLGGITYTANFGTLEPGASTEVLAGHYSAANSEVVRVSWMD